MAVTPESAENTPVTPKLNDWTIAKSVDSQEARWDIIAANHKVLKDFQGKNWTDSLSFWDKDFQDLITSWSPESVMKAQELLNGWVQELWRDKVPVDGKLTEKFLKILMNPHGSWWTKEGPGGD